MSLRRGFGKVALLGAAVVAMAIALVAVLPSLPEVLNPFKESEVDRTNPAVLHSLSDLADYHASTGELQVTVDVEKDVKYVPSIIKGERVIYEAIGTVDGVVDLSGLNDDSIVVDEDGTVTVILPHATLSKVTLDLERSKIVRRDRGLLDRAAVVVSERVAQPVAAAVGHLPRRDVPPVVAPPRLGQPHPCHEQPLLEHVRHLEPALQQPQPHRRRVPVPPFRDPLLRVPPHQEHHPPPDRHLPPLGERDRLALAARRAVPLEQVGQVDHEQRVRRRARGWPRQEGPAKLQWHWLKRIPRFT